MASTRAIRWYRLVRRALYVAGAVVACFGVFTWVAEAPDRRSQRELMEAQFVDRAYQILSSASWDDRTPEFNGDLLRTAIDTLSSRGYTVVASAGDIHLSRFDFPCGD